MLNNEITDYKRCTDNLNRSNQVYLSYIGDGRMNQSVRTNKVSRAKIDKESGTGK